MRERCDPSDPGRTSYRHQRPDRYGHSFPVAVADASIFATTDLGMPATVSTVSAFDP